MQKCSDCHALFDSVVKAPGDILQHGDLVHDHGMNDACFNCHSQQDRNKLVLRNGAEIEFGKADSTEGCNKGDSSNEDGECKRVVVGPVETIALGSNVGMVDGISFP